MAATHSGEGKLIKERRGQNKKEKKKDKQQPWKRKKEKKIKGTKKYFYFK